MSSIYRLISEPSRQVILVLKVLVILIQKLLALILEVVLPVLKMLVLSLGIQRVWRNLTVKKKVLYFT